METVQSTTYSDSAYAGFWLRLAAHIIDHFILGFVIGGLVSFTMLIMGLGLGILDDMDDPASQMIFVSYSVVIGLVSLVITWLYYAMMESSSYQGTLGKMALSLKVTDLEGNRISFTRATGRFFGKLLSSAIFSIGYLMIAFTEKKQGLHDILAGCLVLKK
jgi:uncharacterized RDD family membrane protein YckC